MANSQSRIEKLEKLEEPYPRDYPGRETIASILFQYNSNIYAKEKIVPSLDPSKPIYKIAGRISARRDHRGNIFFDIFDQTGSMQLHVKEQPAESEKNPNAIPNSAWDVIEACDIGDMVGAEGTLGQNPRGEPLLQISNFTLLAKALKDPPANFHGVKNPEHKYRHREQDLLSSAETRESFKTRAEIVFEIRKYLNERDFIEIECPVLQPIYGGATARPFETKHNALGQKFFLSISSELYLKRAMVGGFDRVYSFSRCFRNEGISTEHNPEFTNLEIFETCSDQFKFQDFVLKLLDHTAHSIGSLIPPHEFKGFFPDTEWPLSRSTPGNFAEAWELYIDDMEIASGASDLNDPREQESRLKESEKSAHIDSVDIFGDKIKTASRDYDPYDQNYIEALEMGALPWAGIGIGIDRLCMLLLGKKNIKDVVMFPTLKNEK